MRVTCRNCGGAHPTYDCKRPKRIAAPVEAGGPDPVLRESATATESTALRKNPRRIGRHDSVANDSPRVVGSALGPHDCQPGSVGPVDTSIRKPGRPKTGFDKAAYNRDYMRKRRAARKDANPS